ncbi:branched-chain amino acid aminotransferase [Pasteurellaceae bacterium RH1A]|nr:branched-chain amino acid aminotransferase [Pasteurellaceae bacterium RH1A]
MCRFPLFETLAIMDGQVQNLAYHQARLNQALKDYFKTENHLDLGQIIHVPAEFKQGKVRCRVDYNDQEYEINFYPYSPRKLERFKCVYTQDLDYAFKYSDRRALEQLKEPDCDEVIIINKGFVSDCTIGNLLFLKAGVWYSPATYLLKGTQLSRLLAEKQVVLTPIREEDLAQYEKIMMVNALNPFDLSRAVALEL